MAQLEFDEETAKRLEALYTIADSVRRRGLVRAALAAAKGERILDVGCGPGFYCAQLAEELRPEGSIIGVDSSSTMLEAAARRCEGHGDVEFRRGEATSLPAEDAGFDAALCVQVLEYVSDVPAALCEFARVLRPGGRVVVWDIDWATVSWHSADLARMSRVLAAWDEHLAHPSLPRTLAPAMRSAGFEQVTMEAHSFATAEFDPGTYGVATIPIVASFVSGRGGVSADEATAWAAEQRELGQRGEFFFACMQFCFTGVRSGELSSRGSQARGTRITASGCASTRRRRWVLESLSGTPNDLEFDSGQVQMTRFAYMPDTHFGVYDEPHPDRDAVHAGNEQCVVEAEAAEAAGFDAIWIPERHARTETYAPSPIINLAAIAARTESIRIACTVLQPTFYNPMMVAEMLAQIDQLSNGRLIFGAGVGYNADHFRLFGVPKKQTGKRFAECMEVIDRAWREDRLTFKGEFFEYDDVRLSPKPYQEPRPPIWIGAFYDPAIERALNWDGWCWWFPLELDEAQEKIDYWRGRAEEKRGPNNWTVALAYEGWVGKDEKAVREQHGPRWEREARFYVERGMSPDMGVDPLGSLERRYLFLGTPDYWIERLGQVIDRLNPDWICLRTRTPSVESGPPYPTLQESLENIHMLAEQVVRYFQR